MCDQISLGQECTVFDTRIHVFHYDFDIDDKLVIFF